LKYVSAIDIWSTATKDIAKLQPGQWVYTSNREDKGIFLGVKPSGSIVVAWYNNAKRNNFWKYVKTLRAYATA
jgi:hypothetical protein